VTKRLRRAVSSLCCLADSHPVALILRLPRIYALIFVFRQQRNQEIGIEWRSALRRPWFGLILARPAFGGCWRYHWAWRCFGVDTPRCLASVGVNPPIRLPRRHGSHARAVALPRISASHSCRAIEPMSLLRASNCRFRGFSCQGLRGLARHPARPCVVLVNHRIDLHNLQHTIASYPPASPS